MNLYSKFIRQIVKKWPGKKYFGIYRFLPIFFVVGAVTEFSMINWHVGETNFYRTFKRRQVEEIVKSKVSHISS